MSIVRPVSLLFLGLLRHAELLDLTASRTVLHLPVSASISRSLGIICSAISFSRVALAASLGLLHAQILSLEVVPLKGAGQLWLRELRWPQKNTAAQGLPP